MSTDAGGVATAGRDATTVSERWTRGAAAGAAAFAVGYLLVVALNVALSSQSGPLTGILERLAVLFYNAHAIPMVSGGESFNFILSAQNPNVPKAAYFAAPVVVLLATGAAVGARTVGDDPTDVLYAGASLAVGYALLAVLVALFVSVQTNLGTTVSPDLPKAALFALAYPVVFGTLGAGVGFAWRNRA